MRGDENKLNATCEVCGERYHVCKKCILLRNNGIDNWRLHCDKAACYKVLTVVNEYKNGQMNKAEAKEMLTSFGEFNAVAEVKDVVDDIMSARRKKTEE